MKRQYRIVNDAYLGYEVQSRTWYWPFWTMLGTLGMMSNTFSSVEQAESEIERFSRYGVAVKIVGWR